MTPARVLRSFVGAVFCHCPKRNRVGDRERSFLRDRFDVAALVNHVTEVAQKGEFVSKLHAAADKARQQQQSPRGRPRKKTNPAIQKAEIGKANPMAPVAL